MAINASLNESNEEVTLSHPELESVTIHPEKNADEVNKVGLSNNARK